MNNREVWNSYDFYTSEVTKHSRYLGFAGIAICWFFRTPQLTFPDLILGSLALLVFFFLLDLAQYYLAAMGLRKWMLQEEKSNHEKSGSLDCDYWPPSDLDRLPFCLFNLKLVFLIAGFLLIGAELGSRLWSTNAAL